MIAAAPDSHPTRQALFHVSLKRAAARARGTPAEPLVDEAFQQLQQGLAELRELAHGIHPAVLSERGLAAALTGLAARSPLPVELRVTTQRATPSVERAIYFTVAEALTNVGKHAQAARASVTIDIVERTITTEIADDGIGGATTEGSGLRASPTDSTRSAARCRSTAPAAGPPASAHKPPLPDPLDVNEALELAASSPDSAVRAGACHREGGRWCRSAI